MFIKRSPVPVGTEVDAGTLVGRGCQCSQRQIAGWEVLRTDRLRCKNVPSTNCAHSSVASTRWRVHSTRPMWSSWCAFYVFLCESHESMESNKRLQDLKAWTDSSTETRTTRTTDSIKINPFRRRYRNKFGDDKQTDSVWHAHDSVNIPRILCKIVMCILCEPCATHGSLEQQTLARLWKLEWTKTMKNWQECENKKIQSNASLVMRSR